MNLLLVGRHHDAEIHGATVALHGLARALAERGHRVALLQSAQAEHRVALPGVEMLYRSTLRKSRYPIRFALERCTRFDLVHAHDESGGAFALRSRLSGLALVAPVHGAPARRAGFLRSSWRWRWIGMAVRRAPVVVTPTRWLAGVLAEHYARDASAFRAVPNGIGEHWFGAARASGRGEGARRRVVLVNLRGVEAALRAFARLGDADAVLELYGTHKDLEAHRRLAAELGLGARARFCGFVPNAELPARLAGADLLLHPTDRETFGQVLAEAAALGIPAVTSKVGGVPEVVDDGRTGRLCEVGDVDGYASAMGELLRDPALVARLGAAARARAEREWRWSAVAARMEREVYAPLLAGRALSAG